MDEIKDISKEEFIKQAKELGTSDIKIKETIKYVKKYPILMSGTVYALELESLRSPDINFDD